MICPICSRTAAEREYDSDLFNCTILEYQCSCRDEDPNPDINGAVKDYLINFNLMLSKAIFADNQFNVNHILELSIFLDTGPNQLIGYNYFREDEIIEGPHWEIFISCIQSHKVLGTGTDAKSIEDAFALLKRYQNLLVFS